MNDERRPTPESMLQRSASEASRARRGRLKVFFGFAPGVGKTYAMLEAAQAAKRRGQDVVIGWVETHGRGETAQLAQGLETIPPREVEHRDLRVREFDLDAALARNPQLLLVDELAHENAAGSRHAKRWQDVVELLEAGIDVHSTINVQHLESLNDVVAGLTGVVVAEKVPDSILDLTDEIELIDLAPDDLLQRLREGKVYLPAQAERAIQNFFKKGNLIALRELALRKAAERVDAQVLEWRREHGAERQRIAGERLLVAIGASPKAADLIRAGRRLAAYLRAPWLVINVETPAFARLPAETREIAAEALALAERLGAETLVVKGENVADEVLAVARERHVTRVLLGKPTLPWWRTLRRGSLVEQIARGSADVDVIVSAGDFDAGERARPERRAAPTPLVEYAWSLVPAALCSGLCLVTRPWLTLLDQGMIFLFGVLVAAHRMGRVPSLIAAVASVAAFDYFFVPPFYTFAVGDTRYVLSFAVMLAVGVIVGRRTVMLREQSDAAREREQRTSALFAMSRAFAAEDDAKSIASTAVRHVRDLFDAEAAVFEWGRDGQLEPLSNDVAALLRSERELAVARWVGEHGRSAGHGTDTLPASEALYLPLVGTGSPIGVFAVALGSRAIDPTPLQRQVLETFVAQTAVALERVRLREDASRARLAVESERTRNALLSSVSHDLRTPLASITGSAQVLLDDGAQLEPAARRELVETIRDEGERLGRLVANLLDLTRLESGALAPRTEWCPIDEVIDSALGRLERALLGRKVEVELPDEVLLAPIDPVLIEQALLNLLENALKYSPSDTPIALAARVVEGALELDVLDRGQGIPEGEEERIFEKFHRLANTGKNQGAGLGLAIARGIVAAHGGSLRALRRTGGGTNFRMRLPIVGVPPAALVREREA